MTNNIPEQFINDPSAPFNQTEETVITFPEVEDDIVDDDEYEYVLRNDENHLYKEFEGEFE